MGYILYLLYDEVYAIVVSFSSEFKTYARNSLFVSMFAWGLAKSFDVFLVMDNNYTLRIYMATI